MPIAVIINAAATHVTANSIASISSSIPELVEFSITSPAEKPVLGEKQAEQTSRPVHLSYSGCVPDSLPFKDISVLSLISGKRLE